MFIQTLEQSPKNHRGEGQISHLLLGPAQFGSRNLAVTWVEGAPGSQQSLHAHPDSEQAYVIVVGRGRMIVDGEERDVHAGTMVLIPPGAAHAIRNPGPEALIYVTATSPPFDMPTGEFAYEPAGSG
jgi:mannose-6-phosphate isomerase-like protein (cupin superfamily)